MMALVGTSDLPGVEGPPPLGEGAVPGSDDPLRLSMTGNALHYHRRQTENDRKKDHYESCSCSDRMSLMRPGKTETRSSTVLLP